MKWFLFLVLTFSAFPILAAERTHRIRCITLDDNYKADGGSFVIQKSVGGNSERASITNVVGNSLPLGFTANDHDITHTLCKRRGMERSRDFANSYEICGTMANLSFRNGSSMAISSNFNLDEDPCSTELPNGFLHTIRSYLLADLVEEERLRIEEREKKVGHIFTYNSEGQRTSIKRIQCGSDSDNFVHVPGANH